MKTPRLTDASQMAKEHPDTFDWPGKDPDLHPGDFVKVATYGERFWVQLTGIKGAILTGKVANVVLLGNLALGDSIKFCRENIYQILRQ